MTQDCVLSLVSGYLKKDPPERQQGSKAFQADGRI